MTDPCEVNRPEVVAEVLAAFQAYECAFVSNDIATLDELFWASPLVVRFGRGETLYGIEAIRAFRAARLTTGLMRELFNTVITTFGRDFATTHTEFRLQDDEAHGRQSQAWARLPAGWRIVSAHVSVLSLKP